MNKPYLKNINELLKLVEGELKKTKGFKKEKIIDFYFEAVLKETRESKKEFKKNNVVYLEDELGDIFYCYLILLMLLERDGYIRNTKNVFEHCLKKFSERCNSCFQEKDKNISREEIWKKVKAKQKEDLAKRHRSYLEENNLLEDKN